MAVSKDIIKAPCVIFLGAGASQPLGLKLMKDFVDSLKPQPARRGTVPAIAKENQDLEYLFEELSSLETKEYLTFTPQREGMSALGLDRSFVIGHGIKERARDLNSWLKEKVFLHYRQVKEQDKLAVLANILRPFLLKSLPTGCVLQRTTIQLLKRFVTNT